MAELLLRLRDREVSRTPILNTRITLGRDASSDVVIDNPAVSRTHAILIYVDEKFRIRDANSQNGMTVNGASVKDAVLHYGDVVGLGKFEVVLLETDDQFKLKAGSQRKVAAAQDVVETFEVEPTDAARAHAEVMDIQSAASSKKRGIGATANKAPRREVDARGAGAHIAPSGVGPRTIPVLDAPPEPEPQPLQTRAAAADPEPVAKQDLVPIQSRLVTEAIAILKILAIILALLLLSLAGTVWYLERSRPGDGGTSRIANQSLQSVCSVERAERAAVRVS